MTEKQFAMWYLLLGIITVIIGTFRGVTNRQSTHSGPLDGIAWMFAWFIYLPIFVVRFIKYKLRGKKL